MFNVLLKTNLQVANIPEIDIYMGCTRGRVFKIVLLHGLFVRTFERSLRCRCDLFCPGVSASLHE